MEYVDKKMAPQNGAIFLKEGVNYSFTNLIVSVLLFFASSTVTV